MISAPTLPEHSHNDWLGLFGQTWVEGICASAGVEPSVPRIEQSGSDLTLTDPRSGEVVKVQIKTTSSPTRVASGDYRFSLDVATYRRLRATTTPSYLVLVVLHKPHPGWVDYEHDRSLVHGASYVTAIDEVAEPRDGQQTVTVSLPLGNLLTPERLLGLFPNHGGEVKGD